MKSILISIKPKWVAKILNGEKTIEVRKNKALYKATMKLIEQYGYATFFIYCSKDSKNKLCYVNYEPCGNKGYLTTKLDCEGEELNGKVVAKFTLRNVDKYVNGCKCDKKTEPNFNDYLKYNLLVRACLTENELENYATDLSFYAYHIEDLVIFDKPKELSEFYKFGKREYMENYKPSPEVLKVIKKHGGLVRLMDLNYEANKWRLKKAPQNFVFVESEE